MTPTAAPRRWPETSAAPWIPVTGAPRREMSARELEVLRLIAAGSSNRAIANQLLITVDTARRHTHNIYDKLGVKSRTQAIA
ncbi:MAG: LuxR C-terminal-related transcriptional regulator [Chloroflexales bacterium]|nr:LuxR C-terminal-related transcriptional regulator [Chloroflexales bacterium]